MQFPFEATNGCATVVIDATCDMGFTDASKLTYLQSGNKGKADQIRQTVNIVCCHIPNLCFFPDSQCLSFYSISGLVSTASLFAGKCKVKSINS